MSSEFVLPIPPGATLREQMEEHNKNEDEMAKLLSFNSYEMEAILGGWRVLLKEDAEHLQELGMCTAEFWMNLEMQYRRALFAVPREVKDESGRFEMYESSFLQDYIFGSFGWEWNLVRVAEVLKHPEVVRAIKDSSSVSTSTYVFSSTDSVYTDVMIIGRHEAYLDVNAGSDNETIFMWSDGGVIKFRHIEDDVSEFFYEFMCMSTLND